MRRLSTQGTRETARLLGVARSTLFYTKKKPVEDWALKIRIEEALRQFPSYGQRRLALHLTINRKRVRRVMRLFGIKPYRRRGRRWRKPKGKSAIYPNLLMTVAPAYPNHVWVADFTHLTWKGCDVVVATTLDVYTRSIVGIAVATRGGAILVTQALCAALLDHPRPLIFHSDNAGWNTTRSFRETLVTLGIQISRSKKGCPWENGYQESFYDKFKVDLGDPNRFDTLGELVYAVYQTVHAYNTVRIHSALKMAPRTFAKLHAPHTMHSIV